VPIVFLVPIASALAETVVKVENEPSVVDWLQLGVTALGAIVVTALVAAMPFLRRPTLAIEEDADRVHSHLERSDAGEQPRAPACLLSGIPRRANAAGAPRWGIRLSVGRAAVRTRRPLCRCSPARGARSRSATSSGRQDAEGKLRRPQVISTETGQQVRYVPHFATDEDYGRIAYAAGPMNGAWFLRLALAYQLDIFDDRDKLPPVESGYVIRLLTGAEDGPARSFAVHINWNGDPKLSAAEVLGSALDHLHVEEV
jgi:hypothetical protein